MSTSRSGFSKKPILSIDIGTTKVRALIFDHEGQTLGQSSQKLRLIYPKPGWVELNPDELWDSVQKVLKGALKSCDLKAADVSCLGISTQRATFVTWDKNTGKEFHNFITWKDVRADSLVREWNESFRMKGLRAGSGLLYFLTRQKRFRVASILNLQNKMVNMRLLWALQNISSLRDAAKRDLAMFGTLDTWLLYKLTNGAVFLSEIASASATGLFDPFTLEYGDWSFTLFGIPRSIMPPVVDSAGEHFGSTHPSILGSAVPIRAVMADQSAAVFGSGCVFVGDTKMTLGTGSFLDVNTGRNPHASINGLIPVVGWRYKDSLCCLAEGSNHDTSSVIEWAQQMKFFDDPSETSDIALSVEDRDFNVFFVPAFCGLQAPVNDASAAAGFIGITPSTGSNEMLRAILESIAFSMKRLQETMEEESDYVLRNIQIDGGVSRNDFVVQLISSLTGQKIYRTSSAEMSAFGAALLAGLDIGIWSSVADLDKIRKVERIFEPEQNEENIIRLNERYQRWIKACHRFTEWYSDCN